MHKITHKYPVIFQLSFFFLLYSLILLNSIVNNCLVISGIGKNKQHHHHLSLELYMYEGPSFGDWQTANISLPRGDYSRALRIQMGLRLSSSQIQSHHFLLLSIAELHMSCVCSRGRDCPNSNTEVMLQCVILTSLSETFLRKHLLLCREEHVGNISTCLL